jgi:outer membrane lipoprotein SlyB
MSRQSYINGFCKRAASNGVDPHALAALVTKEAQAGSASNIWSQVMQFLSKAKDAAKGAYGDLKENYKFLDPKTKALVNTAGGTLLGGTVGGLFGGKKGALAGSVLGGATGAATQVDWKSILKKIEGMNKKTKTENSGAASDVSNASV